MCPEMKLHDIDVADFIRTVEKCKGNVFLRTAEGDCFNLKSRLSAIVGLAELIKGGIIAEAVLQCELQEDETKLFRFNLFREVPKD